MRLTKATATLAVVGAALIAPGSAEPAAAAVSATTSGTVVTVTATGSQAVTFTCPGGQFRVENLAPTPAIACSAVTEVRVNGDSSPQNVYGAPLDSGAFPAGPRLVVNLGGGDDSVQTTSRADSITMGPGDDFVSVNLPSTPDSLVDLGTGLYDTYWLGLSGGDGSVDIVSSSASVSVLAALPSPAVAHLATGAETVTVSGGEADETIDASGVVAASNLGSVSLFGGYGDDEIHGGDLFGYIDGGPGANVIHAGPDASTIWSSSPTDTIHGNPAGNGWVYDSTSGRSGGRSLLGDFDDYGVVGYNQDSDSVARIRPHTGGAILRTYSLQRPGRQVIPGNAESIGVTFSKVGQVKHLSLADVVAVNRPVHVNGGVVVNDLLDVTIPTGSWTAAAPGGNLTVDPSDPGLANITAANIASWRVHGPWTNLNQGFAHRAHRDLLFRFSSNAWRDTTRDQLTNGTRTRAQIVSGLMDTDEFRGIEVDRVFVDFLRRTSDPGGRAYWIGSLAGGKTMRTFRAQLFGSPEYFDKAGGTNGAFMNRAYYDVMGRLPDPGGYSYWVGKLDGGMDRGSVVNTFLASAEARRSLVNDQFLRFVDRDANASEQAHWLSVLAGNATDGERSLVASLAASAAYYNRT